MEEPELQARTRWAVENILESENLTADLTDVEAKQLLEWGTAQARRLAAEAPEALDERLAALRQLMRGVNKLAAEGRPVDDERLRVRVERLLEMAKGWFDGQGKTGAVAQTLESIGGDDTSFRRNRHD